MEGGVNLVKVSDLGHEAAANYLSEMQSVHNRLDVKDWDTALRAVARRWDLTIPE